jgi:hypothetical protein
VTGNELFRWLLGSILVSFLIRDAWLMLSGTQILSSPKEVHSLQQGVFVQLGKVYLPWRTMKKKDNGYIYSPTGDMNMDISLLRKQLFPVDQEESGGIPMGVYDVDGDY